MPHSQSQTVVVENPMSVDSSGKLVITIAFLFWVVLDAHKSYYFNPYTFLFIINSYTLYTFLKALTGE